MGWAEWKSENLLRKKMIKETLLYFVPKEGGEKAQQVWRDIIDKPIKMNAEVAHPCFAVIQPLQSGSGLT